ncbi:MAG: hypothetical protein COB69_02050 [Phycisphaera sp.]|nr:MAG: hypothetical protein COB69_02050 [Phycisphaera sp.]
MKLKPVAFISALALSMLIIGCAPVKVTGKVISGRLSVITSVPPGDARLKGEGIAFANIVAVQEARHNTILTAVADANGMFSIPLKGDGALGRPITFEVQAEGYLPAQVTMPTPTPNQKLLVVLKPMRASDE